MLFRSYDSVVFKDASGTAVPRTVYETIRNARKLLGKRTKLVYHTHETAGISIACYLAAIDGGADQVDCSLVPVSGGTCQPDIMVLYHALRGTEYDLGIDPKKVLDVERVFTECMDSYFLPPEALSVDPQIQFSPMPGGALTANTQMMRDSDILDKYRDVIEAMEEVIAVGGFGTSVTPVSQFYFQQALNNVMFGKWNRIADGYGKMVLGYFGKTPVPPKPEIVEICTKRMNLPATTESPLEINERDPKKGVKAAMAMLTEAGLPVTDESLFIAATCREKGIQFLQGKGPLNIRRKGDAAEGGSSEAAGSGAKGAKDGAASGNAAEAKSAPPAPPVVRDIGILCESQGRVSKCLVKAGDAVEAGALLLATDFMGMETDVFAPAKGTVLSVAVAEGDFVRPGHELLALQTRG